MHKTVKKGSFSLGCSGHKACWVGGGEGRKPAVGAERLDLSLSSLCDLGYVNGTLEIQGRLFFKSGSLHEMLLGSFLG